MGIDINVHDQWAVESPGYISDRTKEHLGTADKGIITFRKTLIKAINDLIQGKPAPFALQDDAGTKFRGPAAIDTTVDMRSWDEEWRIQDNSKRQQSAWAKGPDI